MRHPLASEVPPLMRLVQEHEDHMSCLQEGDRKRSLNLTSRLDVPMLLNVASNAMVCDCVGMDKIYEGELNLW
jgi:hypothetical protein